MSFYRVLYSWIWGIRFGQQSDTNQNQQSTQTMTHCMRFSLGGTKSFARAKPPKKKDWKGSVISYPFSTVTEEWGELQCTTARQKLRSQSTLRGFVKSSNTNWLPYSRKQVTDPNAMVLQNTDPNAMVPQNTTLDIYRITVLFLTFWKCFKENISFAGVSLK